MTTEPTPLSTLSSIESKIVDMAFFIQKMSTGTPYEMNLQQSIDSILKKISEDLKQ